MGSMNVVAKYVSTETSVTVMQMGVFRGFFMTLGSYSHCRFRGIDFLKIPDGMGLLLAMRGLFGSLSSLFAFYGIFLMPLSLAVVLYYTQPISASVINCLFNGEKLGALQIISIFSSMVGVVFLTCPEVLIPSLREDT